MVFAATAPDVEVVEATDAVTGDEVTEPDSLSRRGRLLSVLTGLSTQKWPDSVRPGSIRSSLSAVNRARSSST